MPIGNITQTMSTISPPPHRGVDVQTVFVNKQEDFQDHLADITIDELNTFKDQLNSRIGEINSTTTTLNGYADTASAGASTATTKAGEASTSASEALTSRNQASTFATNSSNSATKASQWADNNYNVEVETGKYSAKHWSTVAQNATVNKIDKVTSTDNAIVRFNGTTGEVQNSGVTIDDNNSIGVGTSNIFSTGGKTIHLYNNLNDGTVNDNSTVYVESANRNSNIICKGITAGFQGWDTSGNIAALFGIDCINKNATVTTNGSERMRIDSAGNVLVTGSGGLGYGTGSGGTVTQLIDKSNAVTLNKHTGQIIMNNSALAAGASVEFVLNNNCIATYSIVTVNPIWGGSSYKTEIALNTTGAVVIRVTNITLSSLSDALSVRFNIILGAIS